MPTAIVLQHVPHEGPGTIADAARRAGWTLDVRHTYRGDAVPDPGAVHALVVMGGPMGVYEAADFPFLAEEIPMIEACIDAGRPVIGFCLGSQLIAKAAGADVYPAGIKEIGWYDVHQTGTGASDPILAGTDDPLDVFHWHGDTFDLPPGAELLYTSVPIPHQAFRIGSRVYAFQFHVEVTEAMIGEWLDLNTEELASVADTIDPAKIRALIPERLPRMQRAGTIILDRWFAIARDL